MLNQFLFQIHVNFNFLADRVVSGSNHCVEQQTMTKTNIKPKTMTKTVLNKLIEPCEAGVSLH